MHTKDKGQLAEDLACLYLHAVGYRLLWRNYICRQAEIDIICAKDEETVFVEVRSLFRGHTKELEELVPPRKQQKLRQGINYWQHRFKRYNENVRLDFIGLDYRHDQQIKIIHFSYI